MQETKKDLSSPANFVTEAIFGFSSNRPPIDMPEKKNKSKSSHVLSWEMNQKPIYVEKKAQDLFPGCLQQPGWWQDSSF